MFTRITGDQKRYVENFFKNEILDSRCDLQRRKTNIAK